MVLTETADRDHGHLDGSHLALSGPARRLLEAAGELFYDQGAEATTIREITAACGVTPGAFYNHFTSKEELLFVLVRARHRRLEEEVTAAQTAVAGDPCAELSAIVRVYVRMHVRQHKGARVANREFPRLTGDRLAEIVAIRRRLRDRVVDVLLAGTRTGAFQVAGGDDHAAFAITAASLLDMLVHCGEWLREDSPLSLAEIEARYVEMSLRLVGWAARN
ncbi:MAG TPA: TetR/AcrR family transcriptional regulator [Acidimicrobiales bacterium]|nr:TetR/AcrR family transcriptional regulator [Acidimicrobiales bacterium]